MTDPTARAVMDRLVATGHATPPPDAPCYPPNVDTGWRTAHGIDFDTTCLWVALDDDGQAFADLPMWDTDTPWTAAWPTKPAAIVNGDTGQQVPR